MKKILPGLLFTLSVFTIYASGNYDSVVYIKEANLALEGFDTVAYFESNEAIKGSNEWKTRYKEAEWHFSSESNLNLFVANPDNYAPEYGGYCAWAMNDGDLAPGKPVLWDIIDDKLYLNYSKSTRKKFMEDLDLMISSADSKWPIVEQLLSQTGSE